MAAAQGFWAGKTKIPKATFVLSYPYSLYVRSRTCQGRQIDIFIPPTRVVDIAIAYVLSIAFLPRPSSVVVSLEFQWNGPGYRLLLSSPTSFDLEARNCSQLIALLPLAIPPRRSPVISRLSFRLIERHSLSSSWKRTSIQNRKSSLRRASSPEQYKHPE